MAFRIYTTDSLRGIFKGLGGEIKVRYYDLITKPETNDNRTAEEIVDSIRNKLKISEV